MRKLMLVEGYAEMTEGQNGKWYWHIDGTDGSVNCTSGYDAEHTARIDMQKAVYRYSRPHYKVENLRTVQNGETAVWVDAAGVYGYAYADTPYKAAFVCRQYDRPDTAERGVLSDVTLLHALVNNY